MIGVIARKQDREIIEEFFELFKTPWEYFRAAERYQVLLLTRDDIAMDDLPTHVIIVFNAQLTAIDRNMGTQPGPTLRRPVLIDSSGTHLPIYGNCQTFSGNGVEVLQDPESRSTVGFICESGGRTIARLGYDLCEEIRFLLTEGQPPENASFQTLDKHIGILRNVILSRGIDLLEVPPSPASYSLIACLTHDVDHPSIKMHKFDHTAFGFVYRALVGSVLRKLAGRITVRDLLRNWAAVIRLPLVHLGICKDFWYEFDQYTKMEADSKSTFFVIPTKNKPGRQRDGSAPGIRAANYGVSDISDRVQQLVAEGCELGLHGLDAWIDEHAAAKEREAISCVTGTPIRGVRMHWLYFDQEAPRKLEAAGFSYDSTVGYNETIGFRAGTAQVYKFPGTRNLLEISLHIMDTALFYPAYMNLSYPDATKRIAIMIDDIVESGGVLTLNWHDRSISPERLWDGFYVQLIADLKTKGAWCTSAGSAVAWFKKRRSIQFQREGQALRIVVPKSDDSSEVYSPALRLRLYQSNDSSTPFVDSELTEDTVRPLDPHH